MKLTRTLITAIAVTLTALCPLRADEALDTFKKEMEGVEAYVKEQEAALQGNPMAGIAMIRNIIAKVRLVKTDGLPADLKAAYGDFVKVLAKMGDLFVGWPEKADEMQAFIVKKATEDPKFMESFGGKMEELEKEMGPVTAKLDELGKKYGLEGLNKLAPSN